ncbi:MAG TPA: hypothetical protein VGL54_06965 [Solirubrobacteraceae bacterium]|jgi:hypothetical protein
MQGHDQHSGDRSTATVQEGLRAAALVAALIAISVLVTGCGGNSPTNGVASLSSHAPKPKTSTTSSTAAGSGGGPGSSASPDSQAVAYAACMRAQGVPNFPDPKVSTNGNEVKVAVRVTPGITGNPHFKSAQRACSKLLPGGGPGEGSSHQISPSEQSRYLKAAACIRSHGVPNFPDPTFSGGGVHIEHQGLNESSPAFKAAVQACESLIPGGVHGASGSSRETAP